MKVKSLSRVRLVATPWTAAYQAPPSVVFSRQEYWSGVPLPSPYEDLQDLKLIPKRDILFNIGDWNAKVGDQEIPGVTGKFGIRIQNETGQRLTEFCQENPLIIANTPSDNTREVSTRGHKQMANAEITLIIFFAAKDGGVYTVSKNKTRS